MKRRQNLILVTLGWHFCVYIYKYLCHFCMCLSSVQPIAMGGKNLSLSITYPGQAISALCHVINLFRYKNTCFILRRETDAAIFLKRRSRYQYLNHTVSAQPYSRYGFNMFKIYSVYAISISYLRNMISNWD